MKMFLNHLFVSIALSALCSCGQTPLADFSTPASTDEDWKTAHVACKVWAQNTKLSLTPQANRFHAGQKVDFQFEVVQPLASFVPVWTDLLIQVNLGNGLPGSTVLSEVIELISDGEFLRKSGTLSMTIPSNFVGHYRTSAFMAGWHSSTKVSAYCSGIVHDSVDIEVINEPETTDIDPPVVEPLYWSRDLHTRTPAIFAGGDKAHLLFKAQDKTGICTRVLAEAKLCHQIRHLQLVNKTSGEVADFFPAVEEVESFVDEIYSASIEIPSTLSLGLWYLNIVDVNDLAGNLVAEVDIPFRVELEIGAGR